MSNENEIPAFKRLPDASIAKLLGLTIDEFRNLSHLPIEADMDINGKVIGFYIKVSTNNNPRLLSKLNHDKNYVVSINPEQVYRMYLSF
jgi:hypothetical protein